MIERTVLTPAARATDPESSHEAAAENARSGRRNRQQQRVLEAIRYWTAGYHSSGSVTSAELSEASGLDYHLIARRLPELETAGLVERAREDGGKPVTRRCTVTGNSACFWWPVPVQDRLI